MIFLLCLFLILFYSVLTQPVPSADTRTGNHSPDTLDMSWKIVPCFVLFHFSSVFSVLLAVISAAVLSSVSAAVSGRISGAVSAAVLGRVLRLILASVLRIVSVL